MKLRAKKIEELGAQIERAFSKVNGHSGKLQDGKFVLYVSQALTDAEKEEVARLANETKAGLEVEIRTIGTIRPERPDPK